MKNTLIVSASMLVLAGLSACAGTPPEGLGVTNGQLKRCPTSPNCVSSQADIEDERHFIAAIPYTEERKDAFNRLRGVIQAMERTETIECSEGYLRVEFASAIMGFVDDVEFYFPAEPLIHVRSASRKGHSDLGINRERIERIRVLLKTTTKGVNQ